MAKRSREHLNPSDLLHLLWVAGRYVGCSRAVLHLVLRCEGCCEPGPVDEEDRADLSEAHFTDQSLGPLVWTILYYGHPRLALGLKHLCEGCPECWELAAPLFRHQRRELPPEEAAELVDRFERLLQTEGQKVSEERVEAPRRLEQLLAQPAARRSLLVRNSARFRTAALVETLFEASRLKAPQDGDEALRLAELALEICDLIDTSIYGQRVTEDLWALAHAVAGNALRVVHRLEEADRAFARSLEHRDRGTGLAAIGAEIDSLRASMFATRRAFPQARRLLARARAAFAELGQSNDLARVLLQDAYVCREAGEPQETVRLLDEAVQYLDARDNPRLLLCATHSRLVATVEMKEFEQAERLLPGVRKRSEELGNEMDLLRLYWVEGEIAAGRDRLYRAEAILTEVRDDLLARGLLIDAGLVSLQLSQVYLRQARFAEIYSLIEETHRVFVAHDVESEAQKTLAVLAQAALAERVTEAVLQQGLQALKQLGRNHVSGGG